MTSNEIILSEIHDGKSSGLLGGPISKWTNIIKGWQNRYLVLDQTAQTLYYYTSIDCYMQGEGRGAVKLRGSVIGIDDDDDCMFTITTDDKAFHFQAKDPEERERWIQAIQKAVDSHHFLTEAIQICESGTGTRQLAELGGYLALLKTHMLNLELRVNNISGQERDNVLVVLKNTKRFIESVEYANIWLQLQTDGAGKLEEQFTEPVADEQISPSVIDLLHTPIPVTSYSSSDENDLSDDDCFFDALEDQGSSALDCNNRTAVTSAGLKHPTEVYDACYEDDQENSQIESPVDCSIFTHLLSQVKLGMDLTRVTLPTFILERRSFLEMIADFLAHPDLFTNIPNGANPYERFLNTVRWYLSAFHAGRKSVVPKKPYNPILGEIFQCTYEFPNEHSAHDEDVATKAEVSFVAEQVSHHPPVSAYYAQCIDKNIEAEGWIWTKSRFLGLSVGVNMVGVTTLRLLDFGEEYTMTFPNAYGRSIFSVPWFELGGKVCIECKQTGYQFDSEFLTKPFYGGEKHCVSGVIKGPGGKQLCSVDGQWNGIMSLTIDDNRTTFFDAINSKVIRKRVKPIAQQRPNESRRLWRDVTLHLKQGHVDRATDAKRLLEDKQRKDATTRIETGVKWSPKLFKATSTNPASDWIYINRLSNLVKNP